MDWATPLPTLLPCQKVWNCHLYTLTLEQSSSCRLTSVNNSSSCVLENSSTQLSDPEMTCCGNDAPILLRYCSNSSGCSLTATGSMTAMPESIGDGDRCRLDTSAIRSTAGGGDGLLLDKIVCDIVRGIIDRNVLNVLRWDMTWDVRTTDGVRTKQASVKGPVGKRGNSKPRREEFAELGILPMDLAMPRNNGTVNCQRASKHKITTGNNSSLQKKLY